MLLAEDSSQKAKTKYLEEVRVAIKSQIDESPKTKRCHQAVKKDIKNIILMRGNWLGPLRQAAQIATQ